MLSRAHNCKCAVVNYEKIISRRVGFYFVSLLIKNGLCFPQLFTRKYNNKKDYNLLNRLEIQHNGIFCKMLEKHIVIVAIIVLKFQKKNPSRKTIYDQNVKTDVAVVCY